MNSNENQKKDEDGLPEVSEKMARKKSIVLVMLGVILASTLSIFFYGKTTTKKTDKPMEETYSMQSVNQPDGGNILPDAQQVIEEQPKEVVQEKQEITPEQIAFIQQKQKELQQRLSSPLMVVSNNVTDKQTASGAAASNISPDPNMQFMNQVSAQNVEVSRATAMGPLNTIIAEGSLIHATMESATNSDLPGYLRASVSSPVYSEDGTQVLVPVGSRLIGQYKSGMMQGQSRIFIVWTRLITPVGVSVNLGSAGVDSLGVAGVGADVIDRHFWQRFGTASLLSILGAATANTGVSGTDQQNSASAYRESIANSFSHSASQSLQQESMIAPTLKTYQGKPIMVFVAKDLHFANVMQQVKPKINVF